MAQLVKNLPANAGDARDMGLSLGPEDPLEKEMASHSSTLAWRINSMGRRGAGYSPWGHKRDTTEHQRIDAFELWCWRRLLRVPWTARRSKQSILKEISPSTDVEAPNVSPPNAKNWLIWKDPDAGRDWRWEEKGTTEDEMVGWHQQLNGHEFESTLGVGVGQGSLACCSPRDHRVGHNWTTELNWSSGYISAIT